MPLGQESNPLMLDAVGAAEAIRAGTLSSVELTTACLDAIEKLQPKLNCFIRIDSETVLASAKKADEKKAAGGEFGPLHGVPLAHKDMYYRVGQVSTCGSALKRDFKPEATATALTRLDAAGALQLGTLNMAEFAFNPTGHNVHHGHCRNPWDTAKVTGGSSSGSGSAVAAHLAYGALGSDTGGSIRLPAAICGIAGLKPTATRVSRYGAMPLSFSMDTVGPLARSVRDVATIHSAIAGSDPFDATTSTRPVGDWTKDFDAGVKGFRLGVPDSYFVDGLDAEIARAFDAVIEGYRKLGAVIVPLKLPDVTVINSFANVVVSVEASALHAAALRDHRELLGALFAARVEMGLLHPGTRYVEALGQRGPTVAAFGDAIFGFADAMLAPVMSTLIPGIAETDTGADPKMVEVTSGMTRLTRPINYLGFPSLSVPGGYTSDAMPFGFQIVGRPFDEATLFRIGRAYEREYPWAAKLPPVLS